MDTEVPPPPISKFAPPRTFEHTPPPGMYTTTTSNSGAGHGTYTTTGTHAYGGAHHRQPSHPRSIYPPTAHPHPPPAGPAVAAAPVTISPTPHSPDYSSADKASAGGGGGGGEGTLSKLKKSFMLRQRQPLSRTWEKASFAEECEGMGPQAYSAPPSVLEGGRSPLPHAPLTAAAGTGAAPYVHGRETRRGSQVVQIVEMRQTYSGDDMHGGLFR